MLIEELAEGWEQGREGRLYRRRRGGRVRAAGAGRKHRLVFTDRLLVTLAHLRLDLPHQALAVLFGVDRSTVSRAIAEVRPLIAGRGFAAPTGVRLRTLADVFAYAAAEGVRLRLDGTEIQVRRPRAGRAGRKAFVSGKRRQNTVKATIVSDSEGRCLWAGAIRPGRMHDQTAIKTEGLCDLLDQHPQVEVLVDAGYRGLARSHPDQVSAPPPKPPADAPPEAVDDWPRKRRHQSSQRIPVEHAIAAPKKWRQLSRWHHRRDRLPETITAIASLASDQAAMR